MYYHQSENSLEGTKFLVLSFSVRRSFRVYIEYVRIYSSIYVSNNDTAKCDISSTNTSNNNKKRAHLTQCQSTESDTYGIIIVTIIIIIKCFERAENVQPASKIMWMAHTKIFKINFKLPDEWFVMRITHEPNENNNKKIAAAAAMRRSTKCALLFIPDARVLYV